MDLLAVAKNIAGRIEGQALRSEVAGCRLRDRHSRQRCPQAPHGRSADRCDRPLRAQSVNGGASADANSRPPSACAPGQPLFPLMTVSEGRDCAMGGGAPLISGGQVIAGVGISGGTVDQDVAILEAGLRED
jgi:hypothetical protein